MKPTENYCVVGLGVEAYIAAVHLTGFSGTALKSKIQEFLDTCQKCTATKMVMTGKSPITKSLLLERGPDDFVGSCLE